MSGGGSSSSSSFPQISPKARRKVFLMGPGKRMVDLPRGAEISLLPPPGASPVVVVPRPQAGVVRPAAQVGEAVQGGVAHALRGGGMCVCIMSEEGML